MADQEIKISAQQLEAYIKAAKDSLSQEQKDMFGSMTIELQTLKHQRETVANKSDLEPIDKKMAEIMEKQVSMFEDLRKYSSAMDNIIAAQGQRKTEVKDFGTAWANEIATVFETKKGEFEALGKGDRDAKVRIDLKVGPMLIANVTGDTVASYNNRQGLVPNQKVNIRDILPTTPSPTGLFVTYRETGTSGSIGVQTEGQSKSVIDYSFTEIKTVSHYIAGVVDFTKQLMYALPWLQTTLPRMLLRDFYKKENNYLYSAMQLAATGNNGTVGATNTAEQVLQLIANQRTADFNSSYILTDWPTWAQILATSKGDAYGLPGAVVTDNNGNIRLVGVPLVGASFADPSSLLLWDNEEVERVETETLRVEFSFENEDNFKKNKVTAKVECFEELNVLRPDAIIDTTTS